MKMPNREGLCLAHLAAGHGYWLGMAKARNWNPARSNRPPAPANFPTKFANRFDVIPATETLAQ